MVRAINPNIPTPIRGQNKRKKVQNKPEEQQFEDEGLICSKKHKILSPVLEPAAAIPRRLKSVSTPLECFQVLWTDTIVQNFVDLINIKIEKKGLSKKKLSGWLLYFYYFPSSN
jgi:ribosome-binding protein aMBF1 (putative translation factor)